MNIQQSISRILEIISSNDDLNKEDLDFPVEFTFYHLLERIKDNLISLELLSKNELVLHDHVIGLIIRNILSDFITTGYIILESKDLDELTDKLIAHLNADIRKMDTHIETLKVHNYIDAEKYETIKNKYSQNNSITEYIRNQSAELKEKKTPNNKMIFETFLQSENQLQWNQKIIDAYDLWLFYSKYEHIGWFSYEFTREINHNKISNNIKFTLLCTIIMTGSCYELMNNENALSQTIEFYRSFTVPNTSLAQ